MVFPSLADLMLSYLHHNHLKACRETAADVSRETENLLKSKLWLVACIKLTGVEVFV